MENIPGKKQGSSSKAEQEFIRSQFEQSMETYRTQLSLLIRIVAVLIIANATVVGYSISTHLDKSLLL